MKAVKFSFTVSFLLIAYSCFSQSKFYLSAGSSLIFPNGANILLGTNYEFKFQHFNIDFEYQRRILGSISTVAGVSLFNAGYNVKEIGFSSKSEYKANYIAVPLMARWNPGNRNFFYLDFGLLPFYLVNAHLKESIIRFNTVRTFEGDIARYSNRLYFGYKVQMLFQVNRFHGGVYFFAPFHGQRSLKDLDKHWGLNAQESTHLVSEGFHDFLVMGLKAGVRIR